MLPQKSNPVDRRQSQTLRQRLSCCILHLLDESNKVLLWHGFILPGML
ncbi:MAG: hypothetical protein IGS39_23550 [Calothrix sp. C42_A2020_038]|nr:hypothetical protein [Calothrix sp. C42_A2020_038]